MIIQDISRIYIWYVATLNMYNTILILPTKIDPKKCVNVLLKNMILKRTLLIKISSAREFNENKYQEKSRKHSLIKNRLIFINGLVMGFNTVNI